MLFRRPATQERVAVVAGMSQQQAAAVWAATLKAGERVMVRKGETVEAVGEFLATPPEERAPSPVLGERVKRMREARGCSQMELAKRFVRPRRVN